MLGFESRMDVHEFLKQHGVYVQYGLADLEEDEATFRGMHEELLNNKKYASLKPVDSR